MLLLFLVAVTILIVSHLLKREKDMGKLQGQLKKNKVTIKPKKRKY